MINKYKLWKKHVIKNKAYAYVSLACLITLILRYGSNIDAAIQTLITWAFAISSHKLFIEIWYENNTEEK